MLVSHRHQFIYTKTNKTAGTSVEAYFEPYCLPVAASTNITHGRAAWVGEEGIVGYRGPFHYGQRWYNHMPAERIRQRLGDAIWNEYFKFCVIRNPFDKMVSLFYHLKSGFERARVQESVKNSVKYVMGKRGTVYWPTSGDDVEQFRHWVRHGGRLIDRNKYTIGDEPCLDFYIKYEQLAQDVKAVCARLNVPFDPSRLPVYNSKRRKQSIPIDAFYDQATKDIVQRVYEFEFLNFGYTFPSRQTDATVVADEE